MAEETNGSIMILDQKYIIVIVAVTLAFLAGLFAGVKYLAPALTTTQTTQTITEKTAYLYPRRNGYQYKDCLCTRSNRIFTNACIHDGSSDPCKQRNTWRSRY